MKRAGMILILILLGVNIFAQRGIVRKLSGIIEIMTAGAMSWTLPQPVYIVKQLSLNNIH